MSQALADHLADLGVEHMHRHSWLVVERHKFGVALLAIKTSDDPAEMRLIAERALASQTSYSDFLAEDPDAPQKTA